MSNLNDTYVHSIMFLCMCIVFKLRILGMICLLLIHRCVNGVAQHPICTLGKNHLPYTFFRRFFTKPLLAALPQESSPIVDPSLADDCLGIRSAWNTLSTASSLELSRMSKYHPEDVSRFKKRQEGVVSSNNSNKRSANCFFEPLGSLPYSPL